MSMTVKSELERQCERARDLMRTALLDSPLCESAPDYMGSLGLGKMLRARMIFRLGELSDADAKRLEYSAAAIEMVHTASLLHDDVIDGGLLRRGSPAFWVEHGTQGAILLGDMILFKAIQIIGQLDDDDLKDILISLTGEVCMAEVEQELVLRSKDPTWEQCLGLARSKTGALFAFGGYSVGTDPDMREALKEAGYLLGTAYQLGDDMLDAFGDSEFAGKTLGSDTQRKKTTAATVPHVDTEKARQAVIDLCDQSGRILAPWPQLHAAWDSFLGDSIMPLLNTYLHSEANA